MPISSQFAAHLPAAGALAAVATGLLAVQLGSAWSARPARNSRRPSRSSSVDETGAGLTIIRPLSGLEPFSEATLRSTFELDHDELEIYFCVARTDDPIVPLVTQLIAAYPGRRATLLIGNERICANPKLNNVVKGWHATTTPWVMFADSNVLLPRDAVARLWARWDERCGMVCTAPVGSRASGWAAKLECAFLNGYQARWQMAADGVGLGFAQGKVMFFQRRLVIAAGGLGALAEEPAEDAAATNVVHAAGLQVRLVDKPFEQPLGYRTLLSVWKRQVRWAQLRRATFPRFFYPELLSSGVVATALFAASAAMFGGPVVLSALAYAMIWYSAELAVVVLYRWPLGIESLPLMVLRDVFVPAVWAVAIWKNDFEWQGHAMRVDSAAEGAATGA